MLESAVTETMTWTKRTLKAVNADLEVAGLLFVQWLISHTVLLLKETMLEELELIHFKPDLI